MSDIPPEQRPEAIPEDIDQTDLGGRVESAQPASPTDSTSSRPLLPQTSEQVPETSVDDMSPKTQNAISEQGLLDKPLDGESGEQIAKTALENEPGLLKNPDGSDMQLKGVADGKFDNVHGIDLVGADKDGKPVIIEVKSTIHDRALETKACTSIETGDESQAYQMDDNWVKDRWGKLIDTPAGVQKLHSAGVDEKYLDRTNFEKNPDLWNDILERKAVVVVGPNGKQGVGDNMPEQCQERNIDQLIALKTNGPPTPGTAGKEVSR